MSRQGRKERCIKQASQHARDIEKLAIQDDWYKLLYGLEDTTSKDQAKKAA
jgi:hypothetical protein